jgi:hypothetical protein
MEMLLMGLCMSMFAAAVAAIGLKAAAGSNSHEQSAPAAQSAIPVPKPAPERFFSDRVIGAIPAHTQVPIEVLIQQIESHVRMEQAAAESFVRFPSDARLHTKTPSPLVN